MLRKYLLVGVALSAITLAPAAQAQLVEITATVGGVTRTLSFNNLESALSQLTGPGLAATFPGYTSGTAVNANINYNNQPLTLIVPQGTTTSIVFNPLTGQAVAVTAASAGGAVNNVRAFFQGDTSVATPVSSLPASVLASLPAEIRNAPVLSLTALIQSAVRHTITDPVAGNPTSLMPSMVAADFLAGSAPTGAMLGVNQPRETGWRFSLGANIATTTQGGADTRAFSAPMRGSYYNAGTGTEIFLDSVQALVDVSGTNVYQGSVGVGVRQRVWSGANFEWNVTPAFRWGLAGSENYGRGSQAVGGSLTSDFRYAVTPTYTLAVTNTAAYYQTERYNWSGGSVDYDLQNQFYRNGISLSRPLGEAFGRPVQGGLTFVDTRVTGSHWAIMNWQEYGVVVASGGRLPARFTLTYMNGQHNFQALRFGLSMGF